MSTSHKNTLVERQIHKDKGKRIHHPPLQKRRAALQQKQNPTHYFQEETESGNAMETPAKPALKNDNSKPREVCEDNEILKDKCNHQIESTEQRQNLDTQWELQQSQLDSNAKKRDQTKTKKRKRKGNRERKKESIKTTYNSFQGKTMDSPITGCNHK